MRFKVYYGNSLLPDSIKALHVIKQGDMILCDQGHRIIKIPFDKVVKIIEYKIKE